MSYGIVKLAGSLRIDGKIVKHDTIYKGLKKYGLKKYDEKKNEITAIDYFVATKEYYQENNKTVKEFLKSGKFLIKERWLQAIYNKKWTTPEGDYRYETRTVDGKIWVYSGDSS